jgi:hypothetical protein
MWLSRRHPEALGPILVGVLAASPIVAQAPGDSVLLRVAHASRSDRLEELVAVRDEATLQLVALSRDEALAFSGGSGHRRHEVLATAQELAARIAFVNGEIAVAAPAVREARHALISALEAGIASVRASVRTTSPRERPALEARIRDLEAEVTRLRGLDRPTQGPALLSTATVALSTLAGAVAEEHARLMHRHGLQDELRLFLGSLRLFDETGMPPASRTDGGSAPDPGCPVTACPITGLSLADAPLAHVQAHDDTGRDGAGATVLTLASLARLQERLAALRGLPAPGLKTEPKGVTRSLVVGTSMVGFRSAGDRLVGVGPKVGASWLFSPHLLGGMRLTVEPSVGGRAVRAGPTTTAEVVGEVRETVAGASGDGRVRWQVVSWQKGRFRSDPLPLPGHLEPGRTEIGLASQVAAPLGGGWDVAVGGGGDLVRYRQEEWKVLDRQGANGSLAAAWHGVSRSGRIAMVGSYHAFPGAKLLWQSRREDVRLGFEADGSFEGPVVARVSAALAWNDSRLPAYDYRSARTAVVVSAPWRDGSVQGYGALAHHIYRDAGPEGVRVAASDQDAGAMVAVQYAHPLTEARTVVWRSEWSWSQSGFRSEFYRRLGASVQLTFKGMGPVRRLD